MPVRARRKDYRKTTYLQAIRALKQRPDGWTCWLCGERIEVLPPEQYNDPGYWTADHDPPLALGGDLIMNLKPAHRKCNSDAGLALQKDMKNVKAAGFVVGEGFDSSVIEHSRDW